MAELGDGHRIVEWNDRSEGGRPQLGRGTDRDGVVGAIRLPRRLREAYESGAVYVAPNPFTYSTRSDTRLLEWLSLPYRDDELGGTPDDRRMLNDHAPETQVVRHENIDWLAREKKAISCSGPCMATWGAAFSKVAPWGARAYGDPRVIFRVMSPRDGFRKRDWMPERQPCVPIFGFGLYRGTINLVYKRASSRPDRLDLAYPGGAPIDVRLALKFHLCCSRGKNRASFRADTEQQAAVRLGTIA